MILMQLSNGVQASYQQCHYTPDNMRNYTVIGTHGRIENYVDCSTPSRWAYVNLWDQRCGYLEHGSESFAIPPETGTHGGSDPRIVSDFLRFLRTGEERGATPLDARMSVATGCMATHSLRNGNIPCDVVPPRVQATLARGATEPRLS
jgi:hypothetical protein